MPAEVDAEWFRAQMWHECYQHGVVVRATRSADVVSVFFYPARVISEQRLLDGLDRLVAAVRRVVNMTDDETPDPRVYGNGSPDLAHATRASD